MDNGFRGLRTVAVTALMMVGGLVASAPAHAWHGSWGVGWSAHWSGPGYGPWFWGPVWGSTVVYDRPYPEYGALDLDVEPETAEVYVDGTRVGQADDYDGFPTYLWLPRGTYDVVIYQPGYRTLSRQYSVYPGVVIDVEDRLEIGDAVRPEDLTSRSTERRDDRLRREDERQRAAAEREVVREERGDWRQRRTRDRTTEQPLPEPAPVAEARRSEAADVSRLTLRVEPADASIYLDGRFVGTGDDLARLPRGLEVASGEHVVDVVRPGRASRQLRFASEGGRDLTLEVSLAPLEMDESDD